MEESQPGCLACWLQDKLMIREQEGLRSGLVARSGSESTRTNCGDRRGNINTKYITVKIWYHKVSSIMESRRPVYLS